MTILIIDDEAPIRATTRLFVSEILPNAEIHEASGVQTGLQAIQAHKPAIVLLDVEMQDGTGFDLIRSIEKPEFQLVFITAHNHYALSAFEFSAIDFVVKPVDEDALKRALERAVGNIRKATEASTDASLETVLSQQIALLNENLQQLHRADKKIALRDHDNIYFVDISEIIRCSADGPYTTFHLKDRTTIIVSKTLKEYELLLTPHLFFRVHHSHLINLRHIKLFRKSDSDLQMSDLSNVPVATRKKDDLLKILNT
ncbi:MAG: DNA-binding response regulator [Candidatus Kapaibacterium sp.]|nr:MAG: DNA-binding response regulator [Candidatus Kapabacteria bacterium]